MTVRTDFAPLMKNLALAPFGPVPQTTTLVWALTTPSFVLGLVPVLTRIVSATDLSFVMLKVKLVAEQVPLAGGPVSEVGCHAGGDPLMVVFGPVTEGAAAAMCVVSGATEAEAGAANPAAAVMVRMPIAETRPSEFLIESKMFPFASSCHAVCHGTAGVVHTPDEHRPRPVCLSLLKLCQRESPGHRGRGLSGAPGTRNYHVKTSYKGCE